MTTQREAIIVAGCFAFAILFHVFTNIRNDRNGPRPFK